MPFPLKEGSHCFSTWTFISTVDAYFGKGGADENEGEDFPTILLLLMLLVLLLLSFGGAENFLIAGSLLDFWRVVGAGGFACPSGGFVVLKILILVK